MTKTRSCEISLQTTPYYHCMSHCIRRALLFEMDYQHGRDYEHRRQWLEHKILELGSVFALDVCGYAVMSNHYHVMLHIDQDCAMPRMTKR